MTNETIDQSTAEFQAKYKKMLERIASLNSLIMHFNEDCINFIQRLPNEKANKIAALNTRFQMANQAVAYELKKIEDLCKQLESEPLIIKGDGE